MIFDERTKQAKLATKIGFNPIEQSTIKNKIKIEKLQTPDLSYL